MRRMMWLVALGLATSACASGRAEPPPTVHPCSPARIIRVGGVLPACSFVKAAGGTIALESLRGKPVVLNFWASWCVACIKEMPAIQQVHTALGDRVQIYGMDVLDVNGETRVAAAAFASARGVTYPIAYDRGALLYANFTGAVRRPVLPLTVFADARGVVRLVNFGELSARDLTDKIRASFGVA